MTEHVKKELSYEGKTIEIDEKIYDIIKKFHKKGGVSYSSCQGGIVDHDDEVVNRCLPYYKMDKVWFQYSWIIINKDDIDILMELLNGETYFVQYHQTKLEEKTESSELFTVMFDIRN